MTQEIVMVCGRHPNGHIDRVPIFDQSEVDQVVEDFKTDPHIEDVWTVKGRTVGYMNIFTGEITRP